MLGTYAHVLAGREAEVRKLRSGYPTSMPSADFGSSRRSSASAKAGA